RQALVETFYPRENFGWSELVGILVGRWKLIQGPRPELYNLGTDPQEKKNLYDYNQSLAEELKKKLETSLLNSLGNQSSTPALRSEDLEKLRSLGYLNLAPVRTGSVLPDPKERIDLLRLIQRAQFLEFEEKYPEAEQVYQQILEQTPDSPASYVNLALVLAHQKKMEEAIEVLKKGLVRLPDSETLMVRLGHTYLVSGRYLLAFQTMEKVLQLNPKNVDALTVCATILDAAGRKKEARSFYEKALAIEPESKHLRMSLAANLASDGRLTEAIEIYKKLLADFPEDQSLYQFAGLAYAYLGDYDQAIFYLKQAVSILPTRSGYFNLAVACQKAGRNKEAVDYYRLYLENAKDDNQANIKLARRELERLEKKLSGN
ncbi:MAG: tetratricopeptide repeat protein, partial [Candidatus Saccharicenans sp.]